MVRRMSVERQMTAGASRARGDRPQPRSATAPLQGMAHLVGNQAMTRLVLPGRVPQSGADGRLAGSERFVLGRRRDAHELEADAMADRIVYQGLEPGCGSAVIRPDVESAAPPIVAQAVRASGQPLDRETRAFFEARFGRDLSPVRIHVDGLAAHSAREVRARAYTAGNHIVFAAGAYQPTSVAGQRLMAHELAHTLQQRHRPPGGIWTVQRDNGPGEEGPRDAGVPVPAGVPETPEMMPVEKLSDDQLGPEYQRATAQGDSERAGAVEDEMEKRSAGLSVGTALPRGPQPVTGGSGQVTPEVALELLDNMSRGQAPFKPEAGLGGCSWFTTEGEPYTSASAAKNIPVPVEIAKGSQPLVFREADLLKIQAEESGPTRAQAELEYRAKFNIPENAKLSNRAVKSIERLLGRFIEKRLWIRVGEKIATSSQKVGDVILEPGSQFSEAPGKFTVVADASKITLKGGTAPLVDALAKSGVQAEPVVVEAAEALAKTMKWAGRVRGAFHYGGRVLIVVAVAADAIRIYRAQDKLKAVVTSAGGWAGATAAGAAFGAWFTPGDAAGPWAWAAHGVGTLIAGGIGYWAGSKTTRYVYELVAE